MTQENKKTGLLIPPNKLSKMALNSLIEEFILREGTDYGTKEYSLDEKRNQVLRQLHQNKILILFDEASESTTLITLEKIKKLNPQNFEILGEFPAL